MIKQNRYGHWTFTNEPYLYEDLEFLCSGYIIPGTRGSLDEPPETATMEDLTVTLPANKHLLEDPYFTGPSHLDVTWYLPDWLYDNIIETLIEDIAWRI